MNRLIEKKYPDVHTENDTETSRKNRKIFKYLNDILPIQVKVHTIER